MRQSLFGRSIVGRAMEILLIEDDLCDARAAMQVLDRGHVRCRVSLVRDGDEAIRFLLRQGVFAKAPRPDLIMLEVNLPIRSGCDVLRELHSDVELKKIPVVVMQTPEHLSGVARRRVLRRDGIHAQAARRGAVRGDGQVAALFVVDGVDRGVDGVNVDCSPTRKRVGNARGKNGGPLACASGCSMQLLKNSGPKLFFLFRVLLHRFQRHIGARGIDRAAACRELIDDLVQVVAPGGRVEIGRRERAELAKQQDQPQQVAKQNAFLLRQVLAGRQTSRSCR